MTKFLTKVAQILKEFLQNTIFEQKTTVASFGATFGKIGLLFIPTSGHAGPPPQKIKDLAISGKRR